MRWIFPALPLALVAACRPVDRPRGLGLYAIAPPPTAPAFEPRSQRETGIRLDGIRPDSLLGRLGLRDGDVVLQIDGHDVGKSDGDDGPDLPRRRRPGRTATITILRAHRRTTLRVRLVAPAGG